MNREEILAKSREDHRNGDERERKLSVSSAIPVLITMGTVGTILIFLEGFFLETDIMTYGVQLMLHASLCVQSWYLLSVLKKKAYLMTGILWTLITAGTVWGFIQAFIAMR